MADEYTYSVEGSTRAHGLMKDHTHTHWENNERHPKCFTLRVSKAAPPKMTPLRWEKQLVQTGSIKDMPRSGRPSRRAETCDDGNASVERSPKKSLRKRSN